MTTSTGVQRTRGPWRCADGSSASSARASVDLGIDLGIDLGLDLGMRRRCGVCLHGSVMNIWVVVRRSAGSGSSFGARAWS